MQTQTSQKKTRKLTIEWRHLDVDGETCNRCEDTGTTLRRFVDELQRELAADGMEVELQETRLTGDDVAESNSILVDGTPLTDLVPGLTVGTSNCDSCSDLLETETACRTVEVDGETHEAVPRDILRQAVDRALEDAESDCACACGC